MTNHELPDLTRDEILRYSRHLVLPQIGVDGQRKLKAARVLLVGAGGLGSPIALYLAAAGVGHLGLVDPDVVSISNLRGRSFTEHPRSGSRRSSRESVASWTSIRQSTSLYTSSRSHRRMPGGLPQITT